MFGVSELVENRIFEFIRVMYLRDMNNEFRQHMIKKDIVKYINNGFTCIENNIIYNNALVNNMLLNIYMATCEICGERPYCDFKNGEPVEYDCCCINSNYQYL